MREGEYQRQRMNSFKMLGLAMHNYLAQKNTFPPYANFDADGRPLLSWRVHLLPYLEQSALYQQFHLDEPWDSEHNRKLIDQMPAIFADPDPAVRAAVGDKGRTTFVVPTGEGLLFGGNEGLKLSEVTDGTSSTILTVEVAPEQAVVWTQPADWKVNLDKPLQGLERKDRDYFTVSSSDGSVRTMRTDNSPEIIRSLLTPAGGEVVDFNDLK